MDVCDACVLLLADTHTSAHTISKDIKKSHSHKQRKAIHAICCDSRACDWCASCFCRTLLSSLPSRCRCESFTTPVITSWTATVTATTTTTATRMALCVRVRVWAMIIQTHHIEDLFHISWGLNGIRTVRMDNVWMNLDTHITHSAFVCRKLFDCSSDTIACVRAKRRTDGIALVHACSTLIQN